MSGIRSFDGVDEAAPTYGSSLLTFYFKCKGRKENITFICLKSLKQVATEGAIKCRQFV